MRRSHLLLVLAVPVAALATPQAQVPAPAASVSATVAIADVPLTPDSVVARLLTFDRDGDNRLVRDELPDRMHGLVGRHDANGDGSLDAVELRSATSQPAPPEPLRNPFTSGGYGFGDEFGISTTMHIEGAIEDLRLAGPAKERALEIAREFAKRHEAAASATLQAELARVLDEQQLVTVRERLGAGEKFAQLMFVRAAGGKAGRAIRILGAPDPVKLVDGLKLPEPAASGARAAAERFKARRLLDEQAREGLLLELEGILTAEDRDNLGAALARRPVVPQNRAGVVFAKVATPPTGQQRMQLLRQSATPGVLDAVNGVLSD